MYVCIYIFMNIHIYLYMYSLDTNCDKFIQVLQVREKQDKNNFIARFSVSSVCHFLFI